MLTPSLPRTPPLPCLSAGLIRKLFSLSVTCSTRFPPHLSPPLFPSLAPPPPPSLSALQPANTKLVSPPLADKVRPMIMWAHLSGVCFTSSGDHSEDKGGGGGGEWDLDRDTQRQRTHKNSLFYIYHARWTPFLIFFFFYSPR